MKRNLQNDKLVMNIIRKQTCKMITQDYDKSVSKKQESDLKWLIIFLGKVCTSHDHLHYNLYGFVLWWYK